MKFCKKQLTLILMFLQLFIGGNILYNYLHSQTVYASGYDGSISFDKSTQSLVIQNSALLGSTDVPRYRTVGFTIKLWNPIDKSCYWTQVYYNVLASSDYNGGIGFNTDSLYDSNGYQYSSSSMKLSDLQSIYQNDFGQDFSWMTSGNYTVWIEYDAIFSIVESGSTTVNAQVGPDGYMQGDEWYKTYAGQVIDDGYSPDHISSKISAIGTYSSYDTYYGGICGARSWDSESIAGFSNSFNQQVPIYAEYITPSGVEPVVDPTPTPISGKITFTPNQFDWKNTSQSIVVKVSGDTTTSVTGSASRNYTYTTKHQKADGSYTNKSNDSSTSCGYTEVWGIDSLTVTGIGYDINTQQFSYINQIIPDGGTVTINTNIKNLILTGKITSWKAISQKWASTDAPSKGSWKGGSPPVEETTKPTDTYQTNSGSYFMDLVPPEESVDIESHNWTNKPIKVAFTASDNLSDLIAGQSINIVDSSWYNRNSTVFLRSTGLANSKWNYYYNFVFNGCGIYKIQGTLQDNATNTTPVSHGLYKYDDILPNPMAYSNDTRTYIDDPLIIQCTAKDNLSGVAKIQYALTRNSDAYDGSSKTTINQTTPENSPNATTSFNITIQDNGTWYVHTWITDRAGNVRYTKSNGYKYFKITQNDLTIKPTSNSDNVLRATRFDISTIIPYFTEEDAGNSTLRYKMPNWINDSITKKVNGVYSVTPGKNSVVQVRHFDNGNTNNNNIEYWEGFVPPYGAPLSKDRDGNSVGSAYTDTIQLTYNNYIYGVKITHPIDKSFYVIPEQIVKTEIIENDE